MAKFSFQNRTKSFKYALRGISLLLQKEHNARIHLVLTAIAIGLGIMLNITELEWLSIIICIGLVFSAELFNTSIEAICNIIQPEYDKRVEIIKDLAAGGVLAVAISSFVVAVIIFIPKIMVYING